jgi:hypothetical protein
MADIQFLRKQAIQEYPTLWGKFIQEWKSDLNKDSLWLTYSANYLLSTGRIKWAIDPYSLFTRIEGGIQPDFSHDLKDIQLVVLTHAHSDHLDLTLISALSQLPIQWIIPDFMLEKMIKIVPLARERIIIPEPGITIQIGDLSIFPFDGLHIHGELGVPSMGYLAEFTNKRWLFPGDIRTYDFSNLPAFGELDGVVGHIWLGKGEAMESRPSKLDSFCDFFSQFRTRQLIFTHLREYGREKNEMWDLYHFQLIKKQFHHRFPELKVSARLMGDRIDL